VASFFTYGATLKLAMGSMSTTVAGVTTYSFAGTTISATTAGVMAGAVGGAAAGFVGSGIATGNLQQALRGAGAGAIMGGVAGYFGNAWNATRVAATAVAGGIGSEIMGGGFRTGFIVAGAFAAARWGWEAIENSVDRSSLTSTYRDKEPQYDSKGRLLTDGGRPQVLAPGVAEYEGNFITKGGMAEEASGLHIYDPGRWIENRLGTTVSTFVRDSVNLVSKIHDWQNSWNYDHLGNFVKRGVEFDTGFQVYSFFGMSVAAVATGGIFAGNNPWVQQEYYRERSEL
jgi:hypothetical protein